MALGIAADPIVHLELLQVRQVAIDEVFLHLVVERFTDDLLGQAYRDLPHLAAGVRQGTGLLVLGLFARLGQDLGSLFLGTGDYVGLELLARGPGLLDDPIGLGLASASCAR